MFTINRDVIRDEARKSAVALIKSNPIKERCPECGTVIYIDSPSFVCPHCASAINVVLEDVNTASDCDDDCNHDLDGEEFDPYTDGNDNLAVDDEIDADTSDDSSADCHTGDI